LIGSQKKRRANGSPDKGVPLKRSPVYRETRANHIKNTKPVSQRKLPRRHIILNDTTVEHQRGSQDATKRKGGLQEGGRKRLGG